MIPIHDEIRQHAKEMGCEGLLDSLIDKPEKPKEPKATITEVKHRQKRKKKNKMVKVSKRKNR